MVVCKKEEGRRKKKERETYKRGFSFFWAETDELSVEVYRGAGNVISTGKMILVG